MHCCGSSPLVQRFADRTVEDAQGVSKTRIPRGRRPTRYHAEGPGLVHDMVKNLEGGFGQDICLVTTASRFWPVRSTGSTWSPPSVTSTYRSKALGLGSNFRGSTDWFGADRELEERSIRWKCSHIRAHPDATLSTQERARAVPLVLSPRRSRTRGMSRRPRRSECSGIDSAPHQIARTPGRRLRTSCRLAACRGGPG